MNELPARIFIRGLRCSGQQGPAPIDRRRVHDYLVDIAVKVDVADAVARDDLAAAIDIADLASCVRVEVARAPRALLERMASDVARALLGQFEGVTEVRVRIEKPEPEGLDAAAEAVELTLARGAP
jgi:dihydroneopterin aldolase